MRPPEGLHRPPRGDAGRLGLPERQLKKKEPGGKPASSSTSWYFVSYLAPFLARTVAVGARTGPLPRAAAEHRAAI